MRILGTVPSEPEWGRKKSEATGNSDGEKLDDRLRLKIALSLARSEGASELQLTNTGTTG